MAEIYGFYIPNKRVKEVTNAIERGLRQVTKPVKCTYRELPHNERSVLVQVSVADSDRPDVDQLVSNVARTMSHYSNLPWFVGIERRTGTDVVWDHTFPEFCRFSWQKRKYQKRLDVAHEVFSNILQNISDIYNQKMETNNIIDAMLSHTR